MFTAALSSWKTSIIGFVGGVALYVFASGVKFPETKQEWFAFIAAAIVMGLGLTAKDGDRGSSSRKLGALLLCGSFLLHTACGGAQVVKWSNRVANAADRARPVVQSLIDSGVITGGDRFLTRLNQISTDGRRLAQAFQDGAIADAVSLTATTIDALEGILNEDASLLPAQQRTIVLAILAAADIALHEIADYLLGAADSNSHHAVVVAIQNQQPGPVKRIKAYAKKPRLRARDAKTGKFVTLEYARAHPDTTVVERVREPEKEKE